MNYPLELTVIMYHTSCHFRWVYSMTGAHSPALLCTLLWRGGNADRAPSQRVVTHNEIFSKSIR